MPNLRFRAMTPDDLEDVVKIERGSFSSQWKRHGFVRRLARNDSNCYVATSGEEVIAYAALAFEDDCAHLLNFAVSPRRRREGVGRAFSEFLFDVCRMRELSRVKLEVRETNLDAQLFYRSLGLRATQVLHKFYDDTGEDDSEQGPGNIHMPSPSYYPALTSFGLVVTGGGLVYLSLGWIAFGVGMVITMWGFFGWSLEPVTKEH